MKISDGALRRMVKNIYTDYDEADLARELLLRRAEVRRLRAALQPFADAGRVLKDDPSVGLADDMYMRVIPSGTATLRRSDCVLAYKALTRLAGKYKEKEEPMPAEAESEAECKRLRRLVVRAHKVLTKHARPALLPDDNPEYCRVISALEKVIESAALRAGGSDV